MEARLHYSSSRPVLMMQQLHDPAASPAPGAAVVFPDARPPVLVADEPNSNALLVLALLTCGLAAALALRVVLQCALHVTRLACYGGADDPPEEHESAAARHGHRQGTKQQPRRRVPALVRAVPWLAFSAGLPLAGSSRSECAICLAEFARGEPVRVLPRCGHGFHARCIDRWLAARPTCPTCRQAPFAEPTALLQPPDLVDSSAPPAAMTLVRVVIVGDRVARVVEP